MTCHFPTMCFSMAPSFPPWSWIPLVDVEPLLFGQATGHKSVKTVFRIGWRVSSVLCLTKNGIGTVQIDKMAFQDKRARSPVWENAGLLLVDFHVGLSTVSQSNTTANP